MKYLDYVLRIPVALSLVWHGIAKFPITQEAANMMTFESTTLLTIVAVAEVLAGLALITGPFINDIVTRLGGLATAGIMTGAVAIVHWQFGYQFDKPLMEGTPMIGWELHLAYIGIGLFFMIRGNGEQS